MGGRPADFPLASAAASRIARLASAQPEPLAYEAAIRAELERFAADLVRAEDDAAVEAAEAIAAAEERRGVG